MKAREKSTTLHQDSRAGDPVVLSPLAPHPPSPLADCRTCGACCHGREGTILVTAENLLRWRREQRDDILGQLTEGHFSEQAFAMGPDHACVHLGRGSDKSCSIYETRADSCRTLQVGDRQCHEARRERGLPPLT
ncbi:MAG: YkgJ family cysteine cluster protein [Polyangiaceae bacterium]